MGISDYIRGVREKIGNDLLLLPAISAIIIDADQRVLLHRSSDDGNWYTIGGAIDPGEEPGDACLREVREETGLEVEIERLVGVHASPVVVYPNGHQTRYIGITFRCRPIGGTLGINDDESIELRYFERDQLPDLRPDQRLRVEHAFDVDRRPYYQVNGIWRRG